MMRRGFATLMVAAVIALALGTATAGGAERAATVFADTMENQSGGRILCGVQAGAKAIICIANADEANADAIAAGAILAARSANLPLAGWSLTIATPSDYVVTRRF